MGDGSELLLEESQRLITWTPGSNNWKLPEDKEDVIPRDRRAPQRALKYETHSSDLCGAVTKAILYSADN